MTEYLNFEEVLQVGPTCLSWYSLKAGADMFLLASVFAPNSSFINPRLCTAAIFAC